MYKQTWQINNRVNLFLLEAIKEEWLNDSLFSKGRNAGEQFAHIHNVRLMWIKASAPELMGKLTKLEKEKGFTRAGLKKALNESAAAMEKLFKSAEANGGKVKNFKPDAEAFFGYMLAHEAHHRSQVVLALKQSGHPLDKSVIYGLWEWGKR